MVRHQTCYCPINTHILIPSITLTHQLGASTSLPSSQSQLQDIKYFVKIVVPLIAKVEAIEKAAGEGQGDQGLQIMARSLAAILRKQHATVSGEEMAGKKTKQQAAISQTAVAATVTSTSHPKPSSTSSSSSSSSSANSGGHVKPPAAAGPSTSGSSGMGMGGRDGRAGEGKGDRGSGGGAGGMGPHGRRDSHDWDRDRDNAAAAATSNATTAAAVQRSSHPDHRSSKDGHHRDHHHRGVSGDGGGSAESRVGDKDKDKDGHRGGGGGESAAHLHSAQGGSSSRGQQQQQQQQQRGSTGGGGHHMDSTGGPVTGHKRKSSDLPSSTMSSSSSSSSSNSNIAGGNTNAVANADLQRSVDLRDTARGGGGSSVPSGPVGSGDKVTLHMHILTHHTSLTLVLHFPIFATRNVTVIAPTTTDCLPPISVPPLLTAVEEVEVGVVAVETPASAIENGLAKEIRLRRPPVPALLAGATTSSNNNSNSEIIVVIASVVVVVVARKKMVGAVALGRIRSSTPLLRRPTPPPDRPQVHRHQTRTKVVVGVVATPVVGKVERPLLEGAPVEEVAEGKRRTWRTCGRG